MKLKSRVWFHQYACMALHFSIRRRFDGGVHEGQGKGDVNPRGGVLNRI